MKEYKNGGFLGGKGFYAALAVCLFGGVAFAWAGVNGTLQNVEDKQSDIPIEEVNEFEYKPNSSVFVEKEVEDASAPVNEIPATQIPETESKETFSFFSTELKFKNPVADGEIIRAHSGGELIKYDAIGEWRTHDGIDISAEVGSEILSAADGTVSKIYSDPLWGNCVEIEHGGSYLSIYCGLAEGSELTVGKKVSAGEVIGKLGETNLMEVTDVSHLHFAMKKDGKFINPEEKLEK